MRQTDLDALLAANGGKREPRILTIDIETSPLLAWTYGTYKVTISPDMIQEPSRIFCFSAKWTGQKKVHYHSADIDGEDEMIDRAWNLLDEADMLVHYNGKSFDEKHLNREFLLRGYPPPSAFKAIDLLTTSRQFAFASRKLDYVAQSLGIGKKVETGGWKLWARVLGEDPAAFRLMRKYNIQDVVLTEQLLDIYGPWIKGIPHRGLFTGNLTGCYACGSNNLTPSGLNRTASQVYQAMRCDDCGASNRVLRNGQTRRAA